MIRVMFSLGMFLLALAFLVAGWEVKKTNKTLETGEKTIYELIWYIFSIVFVILGIRVIV